MHIHRYICIFVYMLAIAGKTAEPNWLNIFVETLKPLGLAKKSNFFKLHGQRRAIQLFL